jgi:7-carboxy-7-deazaguanine synthase
LTAEEIGREVSTLRGTAEWVVLSGGNPLIWDLREVVWILRKSKLVAVETQGSIFRDWLLDVDSVIVSPKPPSAGAPHSDWLRRLDTFMSHLEGTALEITLKIVAFTSEDLDFARLVRQIFPRVPMYLSCGTRPGEEVSETLDRQVSLVRDSLGDSVLGSIPFLPQLHVLLWGHRQGV